MVTGVGSGVLSGIVDAGAATPGSAERVVSLDKLGFMLGSLGT
jgi:hypothetical protein